MIISFEMGPEFKRTVSELSAMGKAILKAASKGLQKGGQLAAGKVISDYLSGQSLKRRSGQLARHVDSWMAGELEVTIGVPADSMVAKYAWLLGDEIKSITPKKGKVLAIPIGENKTGTGVPRFKSPRDVEGGFWFKSKSGKLLFGYKKGKTGRGKFRLLFIGLKSVTIHGTGALLDGVLDSIDAIAAQMENEIGKIKDIN